MAKVPRRNDDGNGRRDWPRPDWERWGAFVAAPLSQAVALSCDMAPESPAIAQSGRAAWLRRHGWANALDLVVAHASASGGLEAQIEFSRRLDIATNHAHAGTLSIELPAAEIDPLERYLARKGVGTPSVDVMAAEQREPRVQLADLARWATTLPEPWTLPERFPRGTPGAPPVGRERRWPWGTHETPLLAALADAAVHFWSHYDPQNPGTAPTNATVTKWLRTERNVAVRVAPYLAQILRPPNLPTGPRRQEDRERARPRRP